MSKTAQDKPWKPKWWPDWKDEPLTFTVCPDASLPRAAFKKLPQIGKSSRKSRK